MENKNEKHLELLKKHFCDDLEADACKELVDVLKANKECRAYYDTIKKTVVLCKENECPEDLPEDINSRLFKALGLENIKNKENRK
jgi:hypothetical protein